MRLFNEAVSKNSFRGHSLLLRNSCDTQRISFLCIDKKILLRTPLPDGHIFAISRRAK